MFKNHQPLDRVVNNLHVNWTERSQKTLDQIKQMRLKPDQDRLDMVKTMRYAFGALGHSVAGWMQWMNSPEIMANFTQEELEEMSKTVMDMIEKFIEYDIDMTDEGMRKGLAKQRDQEEVRRFVI